MAEIEFEPVLRKGSPHLRRKYPRDFESSSEYRKETMLLFGEACRESRNKSYEEVVDNVRIRMNEKPKKRLLKKRVIELTPQNLKEIQRELLLKDVGDLLGNYEIIIKEARIDELVDLLEHG